MAACERYVKATHRKVFFEYVMLAGVNDDTASAHALAALMRGRLYHVNLIPYNSTPDGAFAATPERRIWEFAAILDAAGVPVTVRQNMGRDIAAACGQLQSGDPAESAPSPDSVILSRRAARNKRGAALLRRLARFDVSAGLIRRQL